MAGLVYHASWAQYQKCKLMSIFDVHKLKRALHSQLPYNNLAGELPDVFGSLQSLTNL